MTKLAQKSVITQAIEKKVNMAGSQNKAADLLGVNVSTLSKVRKGDPDNLISQEMWNKLAYKLDLAVDWHVADTKNLSRIVNVCKHSQAKKLNRIVSAPPGTGKTFGLKYFAANNPNVFYLSCGRWRKSKFVDSLWAAIGETKSTMHSDDKIEVLSEKLNEKGNALLIIDEVHRLEKEAFFEIHTIANNCEGFAGIVITGAENLRRKFDIGMRYNTESFYEILSRFGGEILGLYSIDDDAIEYICRANGVESREEINEVISYTKDDLRRTKAKIDELKLKHAKYAKDERSDNQEAA